MICEHRDDIYLFKEEIKIDYFPFINRTLVGFTTTIFFKQDLPQKMTGFSFL